MSELSADHEPRELELLRELRSDGDELSDEQFALGLARLEREIDGSSRAGRRPRPRATRARRRGALWAGVGIVAAGALAGVMLVVTPSPVVPQDSPAEASELLHRAAERVLEDEQLIQPGQYWRVEERWEGMGSAMDKSIDPVPEAVNFWSTSTNVVYTSAVPGEPAVRRQGPMSSEGLVGPTPYPEAEAEQRVADFLQQRWDEDPHEFLLSGEDTLSGAPSEGGADALKQYIMETTCGATCDVDDWEAFLYEDPAELDAAVSTGFTREVRTFGLLTTLIGDPSKAAALRSAAFEVLAELRGVRITGTDVAVGERRGVEIAWDEAFGRTSDWYLVIDPDTAEIIGTREAVNAHPDAKLDYPWAEPADTVFSVAFETSIVDEIPPFEQDFGLQNPNPVADAMSAPAG